ncbi:cell division protein FtsL [Cohnella fermenti]|nr:cell division protein FtsL [Cohnella fermenti]
MQYYGNLAMSPAHKKPLEQPPQRRPQMPPANRPRRRSIPLGEKLLYLLTVFVFVAVSSLVVYRYAGLYQMNREIQTTTSQYEQEAELTKDLQQEINKLKDPSRVEKIGKELGLEKAGVDQAITVQGAGGQSATALAP